MKNLAVSTEQLAQSALSEEQLLVERIKDGEETAMEDVIQQFGGKIYYLALQYTKNPQDAEEVLQDVLLKVFRKIDSFRAAARLSPWIYKIAVNTSLMKLRERRKHRVSSTVALQDWMAEASTEPTGTVEAKLRDSSPNAEQSLMRNEIQDTVRRAIARLPKIYKTVVQLRDIEGLSLEEIGDALQVSIPAVKSRLHRARLIIHKTIVRFQSGQAVKTH